MGVFTIEYQQTIRPVLESAVIDALSKEVKEAALTVLKKSATERIYDAYSPKYSHRRYDINTDDEVYETITTGNQLTITAIPPLQGTDYGVALSDVISDGLTNYNMPSPRPWMDEGIEENIEELESALARGLHRQGF